MQENYDTADYFMLMSRRGLLFVSLSMCFFIRKSCLFERIPHTQ